MCLSFDTSPYFLEYFLLLPRNSSAMVSKMSNMNIHCNTTHKSIIGHHKDNIFLFSNSTKSTISNSQY